MASSAPLGRASSAARVRPVVSRRCPQSAADCHPGRASDYVVTGSQDALINAYAVPEGATSSSELQAAASDDPARTAIGHSANVCCLDGLPDGSGIGASAAPRALPRFSLTFMRPLLSSLRLVGQVRPPQAAPLRGRLSAQSRLLTRSALLQDGNRLELLVRAGSGAEGSRADRLGH